MSHYNTVALFAAVWMKIMHSTLFLQGWMEELAFFKTTAVSVSRLRCTLSSLWHLIPLSLILYSLTLPLICTSERQQCKKFKQDQVILWPVKPQTQHSCQKRVSQVVYNIDSSLERTLCDHRGMDRQGQKLEHCPEVTHRHVYHNTNTRLEYLFIFKAVEDVVGSKWEQNMKATSHPTYDVHVHLRSVLHIAYKGYKRECTPAKVKALAGCIMISPLLAWWRCKSHSTSVCSVWVQ